jgi:serine/threonine-protein kinase
MVRQIKFGRYEVLATLGQGAMGTVYKAVDPLIERTVAIKTINLDLSNEERAEFEERFYREAKSAGRLSHANIVTIYDVGETDDIAYIAMEFLEGKSLREMLDSGVVLPIEKISKIVARIAGALNYAHENQVVHRDIKPANIMITSNRDVKIMDFGIAQIPTGSRTQLGTVLGSPKYMAPEQVDGKSTDGKTDIYALGVVLYEMLTGTTPFNGDNLSAILYKILNEAPVPPSTLNPRVPPVFDRIVLRALSKHPEDRYQTAREFARDLRNQDAAQPQDIGHSEAASKPAKTSQVNRPPAGQQDATVFLPPHQARKLITPAVSQEGFATKGANALREVRLRHKLLLFGVPLLALVVFTVYSPSPEPVSEVEDRQNTPRVAAISATAPPAAVEVPDEKLVPPVAPFQRAEPITAQKTASAVASTPASVTPAPATLKEQGASTVLFAVSPWGEIFVDGKSVGIAPPLTTLQLDAGTHRVEIRNQGFASYRDTVHLKPGQSLKIRHKFR